MRSVFRLGRGHHYLVARIVIDVVRIEKTEAQVDENEITDHARGTNIALEETTCIKASDAGPMLIDEPSVKMEQENANKS
ncbi:unnamed protein product [Ilex paraguariensis]|uniref:Uncharacterized protein n=1 Tax=Ilex paraguariensis TaxID=185542 RepID=A0ABC8RCZ4_9AQUA